MKRPTLNDPAEFAIIRSIYFKDSNPFKEDIDPIEKLERIESKHKNNSKSPR